MISNIKTFLSKFTNTNSSSITVNGRTFKGNNVSIVNGKITVDGKEVDMPEEKQIHIRIDGDIGSLNLDCGEIEVSGDVGNLVSRCGNVTVGGDVKGEATLNMGDLECENVFADVQVDMGNVKASTIHGAVSTKMGNISR